MGTETGTAMAAEEDPIRNQWLQELQPQLQLQLPLLQLPSRRKKVAFLLQPLLFLHLREPGAVEDLLLLLQQLPPLCQSSKLQLLQLLQPLWPWSHSSQRHLPQ
jgi:hypothetical protein